MILDDIVAHKRAELAVTREAWPIGEVRRQAERAAAPRGFKAALQRPGLSVIAEVKRKSPSKGVLRTDVDPVALARTYASEGASCISVLTDRHYFNGSNADLEAIHGQLAMPLLRKDFTLDEYQVWEARAIGADAILLIVRALEPEQLRRLLGLATELNLDALVEVHREEEIAVALEAGADLIGINNRNLDSMEVDIETTVRLRPRVSAGITVVSESGIRGPEDLPAIIECGIDAILVGEALMSAEDPGAALRSLVRVGAAA